MSQSISNYRVRKRRSKVTPRSVQIEMLQCLGLVDRYLKRIRLTRCNRHHSTHRVTGIGGGEGAVHHVDARYLLRRDEAPPRSTNGVVVCYECRQRNTVGVHETPRTGAYPPNTGANCCLRIAVIAFPYVNARQILHRIFRIDEVDGLVCFGCGDTCRYRQGEKLNGVDASFRRVLRSYLDGAKFGGAISVLSYRVRFGRISGLSI